MTEEPAAAHDEPELPAEPEWPGSKLLVVGLGNPGARYQGTPHNAGFAVLEILAARWSITLAPSRQIEGLAGSGLVDGRAVHLLKPLTYMNLSGSAVAPYLRRQALTPDQALVVFDDIDLPLGRLRLRRRGSPGGHKGLLSILNSLGVDDVPRLRVGIHPPQADKPDTLRYVLKKLPPANKEHLARACEMAADAIEAALRIGFAAAMNEYNGRRVEP